MNSDTETTCSMFQSLQKKCCVVKFRVREDEQKHRNSTNRGGMHESHSTFGREICHPNANISPLPPAIWRFPSSTAMVDVAAVDAAAASSLTYATPVSSLALAQDTERVSIDNDDGSYG